MRCLALCLLSLSACNPHGDVICGRIGPRINQPATDWIEQQRVMISCIDHWSARLSQSPDTATEAADAAIGACDDAIQLYVELYNRDAAGGAIVKVEDALRRYRREALFRVVQWRAGDCPVPAV